MDLCTIEYWGGLGNQLFQIFALFNYAIETGKVPVLSYSDSSPSITQRTTYWNSVFSEFKNFLMGNPKWTSYQDIDCHIYNKIPHKPGNIMLFGYFQSWKYFQDNIEHMLTFFKIQDKIKVVENKFKPQYLSRSISSQVTRRSAIIVSVHFRLGDYKRFQQHHPILPPSYYKNAINYLRTLGNTNIKLLCFCEKEDVEYVTKVYLVELNVEETVIVSAEIPDWEQLFLMSCCDWNVIANSTFSWWGAFFKPNQDQVLYPNRWFNTSTPADLMLEKWICISIEPVV